MVIDDLARRIIRSLELSPRASVRSLAQTLGVSREAIQDRIERMQAAGLIRVTVRRHPTLHGPTAVAVSFGIRVSPDHRAGFELALAQMPDLSSAVRVTGRYDFVLFVTMPSLGEAAEFADAIVQRVAGVEAIEMLPHIREFKRRDGSDDRRGGAGAGVTQTPRLLDQVDGAILQQLAEDGRRPYTEIARSLGMPLSTVHQRVASAERTGAIAFVLVTDPALAGHPAEAFFALDCEPRFIEFVGWELAGCAELPMVAEISGPLDLLCWASLPDYQALAAFKARRLELLPGLLRLETWATVRPIRRYGVNVSLKTPSAPSIPPGGAGALGDAS